jgi:hypothetical protein
LFIISVLLDVQANLPETSPYFVFPNGFGEHVFTVDESFTKHLPFSLLAKNLKKQCFEARSLNHYGIF